MDPPRYPSPAMAATVAEAASQYVITEPAGSGEDFRPRIAEARAEGIAEARAEGIAEARAEGIAEARAEGIAEKP